MKDSFGDRMKHYESFGTRDTLSGIMPVVARIDGRAFSNFTKAFEKPFDNRLTDSMVSTGCDLVQSFNADIGYVQSDEISLVFLPKENGDLMFGGKTHKLNSTLASFASVSFLTMLMQVDLSQDIINHVKNKKPHFDCRVWNVPTSMEASNAILWRVHDARRNGISVTYRHVFGHSEMQGKTSLEMLEELKDNPRGASHMSNRYNMTGSFIYKEGRDIHLIPGEDYANLTSSERVEYFHYG